MNDGNELQEILAYVHETSELLRNGIAELRAVTERQVEVSQAQQQAMHSMSVWLAALCHNIGDLSKVAKSASEAYVSASETARSAAVISRNNQMAIAAMLEEMRKQ